MKNLKIGVTYGNFDANLQFNSDFSYLKTIGFDCLDYQGFTSGNSPLYKMKEDEFVCYLASIKKAADAAGLSFSQTHALWDIDVEENDRENLFSYYKKSLYGCYLLGCPYLVLHPISPKTWREDFDIDDMKKATTQLIKYLIPFCEKYGVSLAIENLPFAKDFYSPIGTYNFIKELNSDYVFMCLDTGHFNMFRDLDKYQTILSIGDKLRVLHIHDNNSYTDSHNFPYMGSFDWDTFAIGLSEIKFSGVLSLETKPPLKLIGTKLYDDLFIALFNSILMIRNKIKA